MKDLSTGFAAADADALPLHLVDTRGFPAWLDDQTGATRAWIDATNFTGQQGRTMLLPDDSGTMIGAVMGLGEPEKASRFRFQLASARAALPAGNWSILNEFDDETTDEAALGWLMAGYTFDLYADTSPSMARLVPPRGCNPVRLGAIANGEALTRDLINTPANDMGPAQLEDAARALAEHHAATMDVTVGDRLLGDNFPLIHAVGRAAAPDRAPRLIDISWGSTGPALTLVGKGVCFDTGGLNLKPGSSMGLMKKDMGGAATVLGLAHMIMALDLPVQLRVLIPAVENAVGGDAFRPGDILRARNGRTVEINNTDAEGRLVLADALALGSEDAPDMLISMATLTGAARVAVGADIAPFFCDDEPTALALSEAGSAVRDPVWRMPFWDPYEAMIEPGIADLDNAPKGGFAGAITAALFLRRFAGGAKRYAHFDIYGWNPTAAPARPKGGVGQGGRAILAALPKVLGL